MQEWRVEELHKRFTHAASYRDLSLDEFVGVARMVADGFTTHRGRRSAHLHFDRVNNVLRGRRGAALTAVTNGGAIPDQFDYEVVLLPSELPVGTLNEDFAFESMPGDMFQLGNASLSHSEGRVRQGLRRRTRTASRRRFRSGSAKRRAAATSCRARSARSTRRSRELLDRAAPRRAMRWLASELGLERERGEAARRLPGRREGRARRAADARSASIFERFFDETGDTHLVVHSPFGSRINRAWGLRLRKRFCRRVQLRAAGRGARGLDRAVARRRAQLRARGRRALSARARRCATC